MTASIRPSVPRPVVRASVAPPSSTPSVQPPAPPASGPVLIQAQALPDEPMRERASTLIVDDDDIVGIAVAPIRRSAPPLPPPSSAPPSVRSTSIPPAPASHVAAVSQTPAPATVVPVAISPSPSPIAHRAPSVSKMRLSITDPTDLIFDGMYGLSFAKSMTEAAEVCAETLARALRARTVVIHAHDLTSRQLRAIGAHGDGDFDILGSAEASDDDLVASAVMSNQKSITMNFDGKLPTIAPKRLHAVGSLRTLVAAPAMSWGRCLAIIEVIDPDPAFAARVADSAAYVADQFAQFISAHAA